MQKSVFFKVFVWSNPEGVRDEYNRIYPQFWTFFWILAQCEFIVVVATTAKHLRAAAKVQRWVCS